MKDEPKTLGDVLQRSDAAAAHRGRKTISAVHFALSIVLLTALTTLPVLWAVGTASPATLAVTALAICVIWSLLWLYRRRDKKQHVHVREHPLLANDQQGFMKHLKLRHKTAIFDGNNLYHFGLGERMGPRAVGLLAGQLRKEGYRVVCFFDANIHYTLIENRDAPSGKRHSIATLERCFSLKQDEIYVVPSGRQADKFILDCLKHLPVSFAVTNDRFRDYGKAYGDVMKGDQWRKGVRVVKNEIRIIKHRFTSPVYIN